MGFKLWKQIILFVEAHFKDEIQIYSVINVVGSDEVHLN